MPDLNRLNTLESFKRRQKRQWLVAVVFVPVIVVGVLVKTKLLHLEPAIYSALGLVFFCIVLVAIGFSFFNWRCPACNKYLGKEMNPKFCAGCGATLQE